MPSTVTLFSVKIASPRDVVMEAAMACDVLRNWNAAHALTDKVVLLPLADEKAGSACDVLIAFFYAAQGDPVPVETGAMEHEIEAYLAEKRPVFIYFSESRVAFAKTGESSARPLREFKDRYAAQAVVDSFNDEKEFHAKFAQQLEATIRSHPSFGLKSAKLDPAFEPDQPKPAPVGVSELAQKLLIEACEDPEAYIGRMKEGEILKIQANGQQLIPPNNPKAAAEWDAAFNEIFSAGYIRDAGCNGRLFQISASGFAYLKTLGHAPIGYIAELGSV